MDLSIVVVNYQDWPLTLQCLDSVLKNTHRLNYEMVVIDNRTSVYNIQSVRSQLASLSSAFSTDSFRLRLIENRRNLGFAKAINQGISLAKGRYLLLLNNDTLVLLNSLTRLVDFMDNHPQAIAAGGKVLNADGSVQFSCRRFPGYLTALFNKKSLLSRILVNNKFSKEYLMSDWNHNEARPVDWVSACYLIMRREAIDKIGLLDERFFMYCEDVDWCLRAREKGLSVYYVADAPIIHLDKGYGDNFVKKIVEHHKSMFYYYKKHLSKNLLMDGVVLMAVISRMGFILLQELLKRALPGMKKRVMNMSPLIRMP